MTMGHKEKFSDGDEWDALSKSSRRIFIWKPGQVRKIKRKFNKRIRKLWKQLLNQGKNNV